MNKKEAEKPEEYAALIGLDWAAEKHDVCIWDAATGKSRHRVIEHTPEALADWLAELQACYPGQRLAVCLEQSRGALMYALMGHAFLDLYPINPVTLARYREAFAPSRAKDDPGDAALTFNRALALAALGRDAEAEAGFSRVIAADPQDTGAWLNRARLRAARDPLAALADYDRAVALAGGWSQPLVERGALLDSLGRTAEADADFRRAWELGHRSEALNARILAMGR